MRLARVLPSILATALAATACTGGGDTNARPNTTDLDGDTIALTSGLETPGDCDGLLTRLKQEGLERVGPYGFDQGGYFGGGIEEEAMEADAASDAAGGDEAIAAPVATTQSDDGEFSGTNTQEAGVDEPDLVKTDGDRMVVITGTTLSVIDVRNGDPELTKQVALDENIWANEMFLIGDRVYLMAQSWTEFGFGGESISRYGGAQTTRLVEVDLDTGAVGRTLEFEGSYLSAREIDGTIRFVIWSGMGSLPFVYPSNQQAEKGAEAANRIIIEDSTIDEWLPSYRVLEGNDEVDSGRVVDCDRMHLPGEFSGFGSVTVLTVDASAGLEPVDALGVLTDGQTIYASTDRLTVATARWPEWNENGEPVADSDYSTDLHNFDITDPASASYTGSGAVPGYLLSQYSLSEYDGYLRVATTAGDPWMGAETESMVTILAETDGSLEQVGQVGGLGRGERIFAVRFLGESAFVVTFRQIDPLYTLDLSDPTNPTVLGELKIPGFSTYLHPLGDGLVMGVGQDATDDGRTTGAQVSIFDVSDMTNPTRISQLMLGQDAYSPVDWDPRAFTWWSPEDLAFIPISWWSYDEESGSEDNGSDAVLVHVGEDGQLTDVGRIGHPGVSECETWYTEEEPVEPPNETESVEEDGSDLENADSDTPNIEDEEPTKTDAEADLAEQGEPAEATTPAETAPDAIDAAPDRGQEEYCYSYQPEIRRTVVIEDTVYTVSERGVQANKLDGLAEVAWIELQER